MKKHLPWIITAIFALYVASNLRAPKDEGEFNTREFAKIPVVLHGRIQPLDSVARNALMIIRGNSKVPLDANTMDGQWGNIAELKEGGTERFFERKFYQFGKRPEKLTAIEWLLETAARPQDADTRHIFLVNHPDLIEELGLADKGLERSGLMYYTFNDLREKLSILEEEGRRVGALDPQARNAFDRAVAQVQGAAITYQRLKNSFRPENSPDFSQEIRDYAAAIPAGREEVMKQQSNRPYDEAVFEQLLNYVGNYDMLARFAYPLIIPPLGENHEEAGWKNIGATLMDSARTTELHPVALFYADIMTAYQKEEPEVFNQNVAEYQAWLSTSAFDEELRKARWEVFFNVFAPFKISIAIYIAAFLIACASLFTQSTPLRKSALYLMILTLVVHSSGLIFRMVLEGRPPVTNLYSSAIFIGWGVVVLGIILEFFWRNSIGNLVAAAVGVITLIIAHNLALGTPTGDTMEMMRAVLDTNFWLATHVVVITLGYSAMFVAGFLGILYLVLGVFSTTLGPALRASLTKMVFGIICFATLFSFVGTVLGGIWADQSWGRFWGWDPKENGALLIVIWCALVLHLRLGGMIRQTGLMVMAVLGNVVTAWSWFGVNMLGIGLHSYGFMDAAFKWLMIFNATQFGVCLLALIPEKYWRSPASTKRTDSALTGLQTKDA